MAQHGPGSRQSRSGMSRAAMPPVSPSASPENAPRVSVGDICKSAKDGERKIGVVYRTHVDTFTHTPDPLADHSSGIKHHATVSEQQFANFLLTGIPPPSTILIGWSHDFNAGHDGVDVTLTPASEVVPIDRPSFIGGIVRLSADDSMSGIIVSTQVTADLFNPRPFLAVGDTGYPLLHNAGTIENVPMGKLKDTLGFTAGQVIIYNGWIGRVTEFLEAITIRLADGSVVELNDPEDIGNEAFLGEEGATVGDWITTKKGNLRRGRWIYGSYNPNTRPEGYVVDVVVQEAEVNWLQSVYPENLEDEEPERPPTSLLREELESESCTIYDRRAAPNQSSTLHITNTDVGVGDKVKFRSIEEAKQQYGDQVKLYDRRNTLGYDINVFTIFRVHTEATVRWQDLSTSTHSTLDLLPSADLDDGTEVWPGELVMHRTVRSTGNGPFGPLSTPLGIGIVQHVRAKERLARVRWFKGSVSYFSAETREITPGWWTGDLIGDSPHTDSQLGQGEDMSMYDLWTSPAISRRVGDIVVLCKPPRDVAEAEALSGPTSLRYSELYAAVSAPEEQLNWLGEVIQLSLHGWLVVRLGASKTEVRDIRVPWECALLACGADEQEDLDWQEMDGSDDSLIADEEMLDDDDELDDYENFVRQRVPWIDENNEIVHDAEGHADWTTDEEDDSQDPIQSTGRQDSEGDQSMQDDVGPEASLASAPAVQPARASTDSKFSYETMFADGQEIEGFAVLDGAPETHHFYDSASDQGDSKRLRRLQKEYSVLRQSLPPGVFVRTWENNMNLLRILILGPLGTPYEYAPFLIDMRLDPSFPVSPPQAYFHSWTDGSGPINPNLYEDGKICLSLLGTWPGNDQNDTWTPKSTILQVLVSLLGLVLVREPWYNEAGFDVRAGTAESKTPSALYSERVFLKSRDFIARALAAPPGALDGFAPIIRTLYTDPAPGRPQLLRRAVAHILGVANRSLVASHDGCDIYADAPHGEARLVSAGALRSLRRVMGELLARGDGADGLWGELREVWEAVEPLEDPVEMSARAEAYVEECGG